MPPHSALNRSSSSASSSSTQQTSGRRLDKTFLSVLVLVHLLGRVSPLPAKTQHHLTPEVLNPAENPDEHLRLKRQAPPLGEGLLSPELQKFLSQYVLIKTPHGYMLGRSQRSDPLAFGGAETNFQLRQRRLPAEHNFQLRVRKSLPVAQNLQLRVRKPYNAAEDNFQLRVRKAFPSAESNFQLRVRKPYPTAEDNFQLRVRKGHPSAENNFQLRVRKNVPGAESNFQLRVRKPFPSAENNFQLRVRKPYRSAEDNFQLRVRKPYPSAEDNFQLRVRKSHGLDKSTINELLDRYHLLKTREGGYILKDTKGKRDLEDAFDHDLPAPEFEDDLDTYFDEPAPREE
eukprot:maker-scaffold5_size1054832-snap-gene-6.8 protein:Tk04049 transcript:maker-scaffold5_size1054832-snap-gene-6.8-mRNA-1 annotation:"frigida-like protein"